MPPMMGNDMFDEFVKILDRCKLDKLDPAGIFIPWAGQKLANGEGGLYFIGMATRGWFWPDKTSFDERVTVTERMCVSNDERQNSAFWRYLNCLTNSLLGGNHWDEEVSPQWGWSNLFKIGHVDNTEPKDWKRLQQMQSNACARSLSEEVGKLRNSLIAVVSADGYQLYPGLVAPENQFDSQYDDDGIKYWVDKKCGNLHVWGYHPEHLVKSKEKFWNRQLGRTIELARRELKWVLRRRAN